MDALDALILGIVQGLTEFLPVSSSGHLELFKALLGDDSLPAESMLFTVVVHFATALSTIIVYRKDILEILKGLLQLKWNESTAFSLNIIISMIPAALIGFFFSEEMELLFSGNITLVGFMLVITALLLWLADKAKRTDEPVKGHHAFIIGVAQAIAVLPGISRSGATISTSVLLRNDKTKAARFSFLMVVPLIFGKIGKDMLSGEISTEDQQFFSLSIAFLAALITGIIACRLMIKFVKKSKLKYFSIYCFIVGVISIAIAQYLST
jgi:undecaprenyl-diphosphatase